MDSRVQRYVNEGGWQSVVGACDPATFAVMADIDAVQREQNIVGDLAEIGVAGGRLLIMLGLLARPDEQALAIDVFEFDANYDATGGATTAETVKSNYSNFVGAADNLSLVIGDSMQLTASDIKAVQKRDKIRIFSIDGAHSHFHTANDMKLAEDVIAPGAVVMVDDITNACWPGVMEGVSRYFLNNGCCKLFPFMMAYNKLWLTTHDYHHVYLNYARERAPLFHQGMYKRVTRFFGVDMVGF